MFTRSQFDCLRNKLIETSRELKCVQIHFHKSQVGLHNGECVLLNDECVSYEDMLTVHPNKWYQIDWHYRKMFAHPLDQTMIKIVKDAPNFSTHIDEWNEPTRKWLEKIYLPSLEGSILYVGIQSQNECQWRLVKDPSLFETLDISEDVVSQASPTKHQICDILNFNNEYAFQHVCFFGILGHLDEWDTVRDRHEVEKTFAILDRHVKVGGTLLLGPATQTVPKSYWDDLQKLPVLQKYKVLKHSHEGTNVIWWGEKIASPENQKEKWTIAQTTLSDWDLDTIQLDSLPWTTLSHHTDFFYADPFPVVVHDDLYIFYEKYSFALKKGQLAYRKIGDHEALLNLDFKNHTSQPHVFKFEESWYMIPETCHLNEIRLCIATDFPSTWKKYKTLVPQVHASDSTILHYNDQWFLFTMIYKNSYETLHIQHSDILCGPQKDHPLNLSKRSLESGRVERCAGNFFYDRDRLIRPAQYNRQSYGGGIILYHVIDLSPTSFHEVPLRIFCPTNLSVSLGGLHTFNVVKHFLVIDQKITDHPRHWLERDEIQYVSNLRRFCEFHT